MAVPIGRIDPNLLAQIMGPEEAAPAAPAAAEEQGITGIKSGTSPFEDMLSKAIDSLEGISKMQNDTNVLINRYIEGRADLSDVMIATSKTGLMVQLAVTTVTSAVNTFKEITQMQI